MNLSTRPICARGADSARGRAGREKGSCNGGAQVPIANMIITKPGPRGDDQDTEAAGQEGGKSRPKIVRDGRLRWIIERSVPRPPSVLPDSGDDDFYGRGPAFGKQEHAGA